MTTLPKQGFQILRAVFSAEEIDALRAEADRVAALAGAACVRHLRDKSDVSPRLSWHILEVGNPS